MPNEKSSKKVKGKPLPNNFSDHDQRSEMLASDKHWDEEKPDDAAARAEQHISEFHRDGVPLSEDDWEHEDEVEDKVSKHIDAAVDESLEHLAEEEMEDEDEE